MHLKSASYGIVAALLAAIHGAPTAPTAPSPPLTSCSTSESSITPCTISATKNTGLGGLKQTFTIRNNDRIESNSYTITCSTTGAVFGCWVINPVDGKNYSSYSTSIPANSSKQITITYSTSSTPGSGTVSENVDDGFGQMTGTLTVTVVKPPASPPLHLLGFAPSYQQRDVDPSVGGTATFQFIEQGTDTATYQYSVACTGAAFSGACSPTSGGVFLSPGVPSTVNVGFTSSSTAGAVGSILLTAWRAADATVRDSGVVAISVAKGASTINVSSLNPGSLVERALCVTASVAVGSAYECGGLRLVVPLPGVRTRNKNRTPTLIYQSEFAHPQPIVAAEVTLPSDGQIPQTVSARLLDSTGALLTSGSWSGSDWIASSTRRIALSFDALNLPTSIYRYSLEVTRTYASTTAKDTARGEFAVVNRKDSPFGPGWWLAGLEQLFMLADGSRLWVGGDGSTRHYVAAGPSNTWVAPAIDRPDTLTFDGTYYRSRIAHGVTVLFDQSGKHVMTINRLQDTTSFGYNASAQLSSIVVPRTSFGKSFSFSYASGPFGSRLQTFTAPSVDGLTRSTTLSYVGQILSIRNPADSVISFHYDSLTLYRITSRTDQRSTVASFTYGSAGLLTGASTVLDGGATIALLLVPQEFRGITGTSAVSRERSYTLLDGPRTDVGDTVQFWSDSLRAVRRVRDALGNETSVTRADARWPGLVTRVHYANGRTLGATYDSQGHPATLTDSSRYDSARGKYSTTTYQWDPAWDFATLIQSPEGDLERHAYDPGNGNRLWDEDGRGAVSHISYEYLGSGNAVGLLSAVVHPGTGARDSVQYDAQLANLSRTVTPLGSYMEYLTDAIGRDTLVRYPVDSTGTLYNVRSWLDLAGRDTLQITSAGTDTQTVRTRYDATGMVDTLRKQANPDRNHIGVVTTAFVYDRAGRKTSEAMVGINTINWTYDPAGNVLTGGRQPTTNTYDALNRVASKTGSDVAKFTYDAVGNLRTANNSVARIARRYAVSGDLAADTLRIATANLADGNFEAHIYSIRSGYDLDGRRVWIKHPSVLAPGVGLDSVAYTFDPTSGFLSSVRDPFGHPNNFSYDEEGRVISLSRLADNATPITESRRYYTDGTLRARVQQVGSTTLHSDSLQYDRRGKVVSNLGSVGGTVTYNGLGELATTSYANAPGPESYTLDALSNRAHADTYGATYPSHSDYQYIASSDRLLVASRPALSGLTDTTYYSFGQLGELGEELRVKTWSSGLNREHQDNVNTYSTEKWLINSRFTLDTTPSPNGQYQSYWRQEQYRYDALGRRVWKQMYRATDCSTHDKASGCRNETTRTIWDGAQILYEVRALADSTTTAEESDGAAGVYVGPVGYVHAGGVDEPLILFKGSTIVVPLTNWRGQFDMGTCPMAVCDGASIAWPGAQSSSFGEQPVFPNGPPSWYGDLIQDQQDGSGYQYRRNRYYDPKTGRFTQEDPIGLAGGLNTYGFAAGDPVNFSDPFGLCPVCTRLIVWWLATGGPAVARWAGALTGLSAGPDRLPRSTYEITAEGIEDLVGAVRAGGGNAGRQIFEVGRRIGEMGLTRQSATEGIEAAVTKLGFDRGPTIEIDGVSYVLAARGTAAGITAVAVNAAGETSKAIVRYGEKGWEVVQNLGAIPRQ